MSDKEELIKLASIFEHSDFTRGMHRIRALKAKLDALEAEQGRLTPDDAVKLIGTRAELDTLALLYDPVPHWLVDLMRDVMTGRVRLRANVRGEAHWVGGRDIAGIHNELVERFGFEPATVCQFIAESLQVPGWDKKAGTSERGRTVGADTVRKYVGR